MLTRPRDKYKSTCSGKRNEKISCKSLGISGLTPLSNKARGSGTTEPLLGLNTTLYLIIARAWQNWSKYALRATMGWSANCVQSTKPLRFCRTSCATERKSGAPAECTSPVDSSCSAGNVEQYSIPTRRATSRNSASLHCNSRITASLDANWNLPCRKFKCRITLSTPSKAKSSVGPYIACTYCFECRSIKTSCPVAWYGATTYSI